MLSRGLAGTVAMMQHTDRSTTSAAPSAETSATEATVKPFVEDYMSRFLVYRALARSRNEYCISTPRKPR